MTPLELITTAMTQAAARGNDVHVNWIKSKSGGSFKHHKNLTTILVNRFEFINSVMKAPTPK